MFNIKLSDINSKCKGKGQGSKQGTTNYNALLGLPDKGRAIKGFAVKRACDKIIMHSNFVQILLCIPIFRLRYRYTCMGSDAIGDLWIRE